MSKIGICDWGIGGLGVYKALREAQITADVVYFSDAGYTPYGKVSKEELTQRWIEVRKFFDEIEVDMIIVACNALSTVVSTNKKVVTIASAVKKLAREFQNENVAIIGGVLTIESGIYDLGFGHEGRIAQPLSALVEKGVIYGPKVEEVIKNVVEPIKSVDKIILACTHYPVLIPVFKKLYPKIEFVDPVESLMGAVDIKDQGDGKTIYYTSGDEEQMKNSSERAFGVKIDQVCLALK